MKNIDSKTAKFAMQSELLTLLLLFTEEVIPGEPHSSTGENEYMSPGAPVEVPQQPSEYMIPPPPVQVAPTAPATARRQSSVNPLYEDSNSSQVCSSV